MLSAAYRDCLQQIRVLGDGLVLGGVFNFVKDGIQLFSVNSDNHQQTLGCTERSYIVLAELFVDTTRAGGDPGEVHFVIYDGRNEVGQGTVMYNTQSYEGRDHGTFTSACTVSSLREDWSPAICCMRVTINSELGASWDASCSEVEP